MKIRKVKTKKGEFRWEVNTHLHGRGSKRIRRRFARKIDADNFIREYHSNSLASEEKRSGTFEGTTFKEEAEFWVKQNELRFSGAYKLVIQGVLRELVPMLGSKSLNYFSPCSLVKLQIQLKQRKITNHTVNRKIKIIIAILNHSVLMRRIPYNPAVGIKQLPLTDSKDADFWIAQEAQDFLTFTSAVYPEDSADRWKYVVYLLALNTGMRSGEIWGLYIKNLIFHKGLIHIQGQYNDHTRQFQKTKGKETRYVPMNEALQQELKLLLNKRKSSDNELVFANQMGRPVSHANFKNRAFFKDLERWGGKSIRFHDLRHTALTLMVSDGVDLRTVQAVAGHKQIGTTMRYTHLVADNIQKLSKSFSVLGRKKKDNIHYLFS